MNQETFEKLMLYIDVSIEEMKYEHRYEEHGTSRADCDEMMTLERKAALLRQELKSLLVTEG